MLLRNEAKVGSLIFVAVLVIIAMYWFLRGFGLGAATYQVYSIFADAHKLDKGADVRMAGVKIGYVSDIALTHTSHARVDMTIWNKICVPADSKARITTGGFIGDNYVDVLPGAERQCLRDGQKMISEEPMNYDKLIADVGGLVDDLKVSVKSINGILGDKRTVADIKTAIHQLNLATGAAAELVRSARHMVDSASPQIRQSLGNLNGTMANLNRATRNMDKATSNAITITRDIDSMINSDVRPNTRKALEQASIAMNNLADATADAKTFMKALGGNTGHIDKTLSKVESAAQQMDELMTNLNDASKGLKDITTDKDLKQNLKDTMKNAAEATAEAKVLLCNLNAKLGKLKLPGMLSSDSSSYRPYKIPNNGLVADSLWNTNEGAYRFDANYTFGGFGDSRDFYRIGAFNVGEHARLNLQMGKMVTHTTALRGGLYASRVGIGADQWIGNRFLLSGDIFRPNEPEYDVRGVLNLSNGIGLYGGVSNIHDQDVFAGIQFSK